jgi:hypothetical protein
LPSPGRGRPVDERRCLRGLERPSAPEIQVHSLESEILYGNCFGGSMLEARILVLPPERKVPWSS